MLQLVNFSNYEGDAEMIRQDPEVLHAFLRRNGLDGVELMFCAPWDSRVYRKDFIYGAHLLFWPNWLDFWRGDQREVLRQFGSLENVRERFGGLQTVDWLALYRKNIRTAVQAGARYLVFHVCHARNEELFDYRFAASDREVIDAAVDIVNQLAAEIPANVKLLFENLWWPGFTLLDYELTGCLLESIQHPNVGIMLDTGHLMNTNTSLASEEAGVEYIVETLCKLGKYREKIKGIHLHYSLSGSYVEQSKRNVPQQFTMLDIMNHVLRIDQHRPFTSPSAQRILDVVRPEFLVHEFLNSSLPDWEAKIACQQQALGLRPAASQAAGD